jgi:hypothetical protein
VSPRTRTRINALDPAKAERAIAITVAVHQFLDGQPFLLLVGNATKADVYSNMNGSAESLPVAEQLVKMLRAGGTALATGSGAQVVIDEPKDEPS